ncbi:MAG TPA: spherulation-specific family 4 protein, partial [Nitrososphaera sp.]|nr:spherulation-specific family 4 protein [Nitrososphaera sp.]
MAFASTLVLVSALISPALGAAAAAAKDTAGVQASSIGDTGVIVPLYIYPGEEWDELIEIKNNNTGVPMVAIVNPASGPGTSKDSAYAAGIREL